MPKIFIDNQPYEVKEGQNLLHAAISNNIDVPYFCWHPALGSVGACRQCAVMHMKDETDTKGRLIMSCMTPATEGTRISVEHPTCKEFRSSVIEWMMTNHPHDCPVCEEGGECQLQDMTVMSGHNYRRFRFKKRTFKNQNLGPFINHEMNRCITCYRCVRYYRDVAGGTDLHAFASSNRVYFGRHEDGDLENEFSGNLVEICPTGVFTDKPFKQFFNRKWDLQTAPSVCQLCSVGCNILPGERFGSLRRVQNRFNSQINGYFLCDKGRFGHSFVNSQKRLLEPTNDVFEAKTLLSQAKNVVGVGSPRASLEANFALRTLVGKENFYDGLSRQESLINAQMTRILQKGSTLTASLQNIEEADAVLVLGEDLTQTAPMMAFAIRKGLFVLAEKKAAEKGIPGWNDIAIRNLVRENQGALFMASAAPTKLDELAAKNWLMHPDEIARFGYAVAHFVNSEVPLPGGLDPQIQTAAKNLSETLKNAKHPVVISGSSLLSSDVIEAAANVAFALKNHNANTQMSYVFSEANSLGLGLLEPKPLHNALALARQGHVDTMVVLENDLSRRTTPALFEELFEKVPNVIAIDSFQNATTLKAKVALPAATFAEGSGTLVNNEGRAQRYYGVFQRKEPILDPWRVVKDLGDLPWNNLDDITADISTTVPVFRELASHLYTAQFRLQGQKIPRETPEYSGRTAMNANLSVHEPTPVADPDSPFANSMEGSDGRAPQALTSFYWAPGWNSVQSLNKYQKEVGGALNEEPSGVRLLDDKSQASAGFFGQAPKAPLTGEEFQLWPHHHIFGSEERAHLSLALSKRIPKAYVGIGDDDARALGANEGSVVAVSLDGQTWRLPAKILPGVVKGVALVPVGLPETVPVSFPAVCRLSVEGALS